MVFSYLLELNTELVGTQATHNQRQVTTQTMSFTINYSIYMGSMKMTLHTVKRTWPLTIKLLLQIPSTDS